MGDTIPGGDDAGGIIRPKIRPETKVLPDGSDKGADQGDGARVLREGEKVVVVLEEDNTFFRHGLFNCLVFLVIPLLSGPLGIAKPVWVVKKAEFKFFCQDTSYSVVDEGYIHFAVSDEL